ncbi:MAG: GNAT family N-acetyltransferase [Myxococcota bacterium]
MVQCLMRGATFGLFNAAFGVRDEDAQIDRALARFAAIDVTPRFEVLERDLTPSLERRFQVRGLEPRGRRTLLRGQVAPGEPLPSDIVVERIHASSFDRFYATDIAAGGNPEVRTAQAFRHWVDLEGWHLFLARMGPEAVGTAILFAHGGLGYLASAATRPEFRGRGVQRALISARRKVAQNLGLTTLGARTEPDSISERNLQRAGLEAVASVLVFS